MSGGQSRASNTVTSNSPHASLYLETTERRGQGGQKQTHNEKSILIYQYGILVIKLRSGKVSGNNLCKHAIRELELAGYGKEEDGPNKWMREQVIEAVALFSSHGNSGFSAPFEINLVKKLCSFDIISPLRFDDGEWGKIGLDGSCQNKRKSSIFKEPDGSIHDVDAFSKVPVKKFLFATRTWTENIHKIGWIGWLFETDENGILTGRCFDRCNVKDYQNGYMPKGKKEIPCREIEISPDNWIMTVESNNEALIELSKIYDIVW